MRRYSVWIHVEQIEVDEDGNEVGEASDLEVLDFGCTYDTDDEADALATAAALHDYGRNL